ncbi:hypothetical protein CCACVL1_11787 [Corchorus capsularis]|uniref:Uncharacterized protein n=1 Tax=Corchorus capsularis TaxID=210143 RepID=A0A1R3IJI1_COCAP|nr:hypothetical protein CCACVL1_11787 [Corchorus capsularis]
MEADHQQPEPKRRKILKPPSRRTVSSSQRGKDATSVSSLTVPAVQTSGANIRIQQAKNFAVAQAQQDGCMGSFKTFDSQYGNFLVPVVPSRAELTG